MDSSLERIGLEKSLKRLGGFRIGVDHVEAGLGWGRVGVKIYVQAGKRFGRQVCYFFERLPAEIFEPISLCSFCRGWLKEKSCIYCYWGGVDHMYTCIYKSIHVYKCIYVYINVYMYINVYCRYIYIS